MKILVLNAAEVKRLLPMRECVGVMREALAALAEGKVYLPLRMIVRPPGAKGLMGLMPVYRAGGADAAAYGLKAICVFPDNPQRGKDAHQGGVMLFSGETGELLALLNASAITEVRTAAVSGVATEALAREDATELAIIGAGVQARSHLLAMGCVRPVKRARVASRRIEHARAFAREMQPHCSFPVEALESASDAVRGADLIVTATTAREPVLRREWIKAGAHINAVGAYSAEARELDTELVVTASLFVDRRESALSEAGEYLIPARDGLLGPEHIRAELGEVLTGARPGRTSHEEITIFKSLGLAIEDLAAAEYVYRRAERQGAGAWVEF
jgi:ornithine cyclodeaminase/alanine dehydrogenase-like protein (mu-crystallin family)